MRWGIKMKYIRRINESIAFLDNGVHEINEEDLAISDDFYLELLTAQENGLELNFKHVFALLQTTL